MQVGKGLDYLCSGQGRHNCVSVSNSKAFVHHCVTIIGVNRMREWEADFGKSGAIVIPEISGILTKSKRKEK